MRFIPDWADLLVPLLRPRPQTSFSLTSPFDPDAAVTEQFTALVGVGFGADATPDSGRVFVSAGAPIAGFQMARAQLGGFVTLPSGFSTLKMQAKLTGVHANVTAFAIGASWASSGGIAEVTSLSSNAVQRRETSINFVVAPVIFFAHDLFEGPHVINAEFDISDQGEEILINAGLKADVWGAGVGGGVTTAGAEVSKITFEIS